MIGAPLDSPRLMAPRVGWNLMPMSLAARMVSSSLRCCYQGLARTQTPEVNCIVLYSKMRIERPHYRHANSGKAC